MSHPAWVCGLKQPLQKDKPGGLLVTPCVGVWIETLNSFTKKFSKLSHPAWVCGLKLLIALLNY